MKLKRKKKEVPPAPEFKVQPARKARSRRLLGVTPDVNPKYLPDTPEGDRMRRLTRLSMKYSEKGKAKRKQKQQLRKKEITERRERLKQDKKAGTGAYATKKSKVKRDPKAKLPMLKQKRVKYY